MMLFTGLSCISILTALVALFQNSRTQPDPLAEQTSQRRAAARPRPHALTWAATSQPSATTVPDDDADISRPETDRIALDCSDFHLGDMMRSAFSRLRPNAVDRGLDFSSAIDPAMERMVHADPLRLSQILLKLIGTVVRCAETGRVDVRVGPYQPERSLLCIEVEHTGIGVFPSALDPASIDEADRQIWHPDLATGQNLIELMHGELIATGVEDHGRVFRVVLPLQAVEPDPATDQDHPELSVQGLNVVVADNNAINRRHMAALLEAVGHTVTLAVNGREAVEAVRARHCDVVFMDIEMPVMDGFRATNYIRALPSPKGDIPIIGLTTDAAFGTAQAYPDAGMDAYLNKPPSARTMLRVITALTAQRRPRRGSIDHLPAMDPSAIETLRGFLSPDQLDALLTASLIDIDARIRRLRACLDLADTAGAAKEAHDMVSVAGNCGASALSVLARDIERACKQGMTADAVHAFTRMQDVAVEAMTRLRGALAGH